LTTHSTEDSAFEAFWDERNLSGEVQCWQYFFFWKKIVRRLEAQVVRGTSGALDQEDCAHEAFSYWRELKQEVSRSLKLLMYEALSY
jgi:hypothetical protein